jgi:hypothetical protein
MVDFIRHYEDCPCCPFYGFYFSINVGIMVPQHGNQCSLIQDSYSPCQMEMQKQAPDWINCPIVKQILPTIDTSKIRVVINNLELSLSEWIAKQRADLDKRK